MRVETSLLAELATLDACEAHAVTDSEQRNNDLPDWVEIILELERSGKSRKHLLRRHDAELIIEVLYEVLHPASGRSIVQSIWQELDDAMVRLFRGDAVEEDKGLALGLATALAYMTNPYNPNVDAVRAIAMERYRSGDHA